MKRFHAAGICDCCDGPEEDEAMLDPAAVDPRKLADTVREVMMDARRCVDPNLWPPDAWRKRQTVKNLDAAAMHLDVLVSLAEQLQQERDAAREADAYAALEALAALSEKVVLEREARESAEREAQENFEAMMDERHKAVSAEAALRAAQARAAELEKAFDRARRVLHTPRSNGTVGPWQVGDVIETAEQAELLQSLLDGSARAVLKGEQ